MLIVEEESPGLRVIQTEAYRNLIEKSPGLIHENCGDFYSKVHVDRLPEAVSKALDKNFMGPKLNQDLVIVDASTFNPEFAEIEKDYLDTIRHKVAEAGLGNVEIIWGNVEKSGGTKLSDGAADVVIASNILFQVEDKNAFIEEARRVLKQSGRVLLSDWAEKSIMSKVAVSKARARQMFEQKGFAYEREIDTGEQHYGMIFRRQEKI